MGNFMIFVMDLTATIIPPILAYKGKGYRGFWVGMIFVGLFVAFLGFIAMPSGPRDPILLKQGIGPERAASIISMIFSVHSTGLAFAFGSLLAGCFYRKR